MKLAAILFDDIKPEWKEFQLWEDIKNFTLLAFAASTTRYDRIAMGNLAAKILRSFQEISTANGEEFRAYAKLHHLTHYAELTQLFGPLYQFATWRFERKHQYAKQLARRIYNFRNLASTVHTRHQFNKGQAESLSDFANINWYPAESARASFHLALPENSVKLKSAEHPFPVKKNDNILRRTNNGRNDWFHVQAFHRDPDGQVWCEGNRFHIAYRAKRPDLHPNNHMQRLNTNRAVKHFVRLDELKPTNDYLFAKNGAYYLIDWIG